LAQATAPQELEMIETLESRRLFAVSVAVEGTILRVTGTAGNDHIFITEDAPDGVSTFEVCQQTDCTATKLASLPESMLSRIVLDGGGGDDFLVLQTCGAVGGDVYGGAGNDEIHLQDDGTAVSIGHGGEGDDLMVIFHGNGTMAYGDNGRDTLISFEGSNATYLFGNNGIDGLSGTSATIMDGGNGQDSVTVAG
jgi:hypothetical protein